MLMSMDGNNSLKRLSRANRQDIKKPYPSNYYLTTEEVDIYKNEVNGCVTKASTLVVVFFHSTTWFVWYHSKPTGTLH